ncbi:MAG: chromosome segregation protein SMC [Nanoarchaeota archaeon]|nr:chromosome segregation protein SMC [Nanoarchaeota archaeon]MBU1027799.1 chromosome segregation protein SMC [Nanoarchaeota archaeon]
MFIKKLVMYGFKSFPRKTEIPFTPGINCVLGPNGSGKSNISDALCFVLGRLSIKSMRAAKAKNLIFLGTKIASPAKEAYVEIVFDNSNQILSLDSKEVSIKRIVRRNGQSIYKINNQTKTRQEILTLLAQAGVDPNGFNIILQGEIQNFVRMHTEERRKVIEEVSGISIYESRKTKSLKELDKTEEKLKEVLAILRERTAYLNNLEKERQQALRYKKLEKNVKIYKASIVSSDLIKNKKQTERIVLEISNKNKEIEKIKKIKVEIQTSISNFEDKIMSINSTMQKSTGLEQEKLNQEIANIRAELAGLQVRLENYENKISGISKQKLELQEIIRNNEVSIKELKKESPIFKKEKEIETKKQELEKLEDQRKKYYMTKSELKSIKERIQDKKSFLQTLNNDSDFLIKQIKSLIKELFDRNTNEAKLGSLKLSLAEKRRVLEEINKKEKDLEKNSYANEYEIDKQNKIIEKISKMDICPLCKSKITEEHIHSINNEIFPLIKSLKKKIEFSDKELSNIYNQREILIQDIEHLNSEIFKRESDLIKISNINEKKLQIKNLQEKINKANSELSELLRIGKNLNKKFDEDSNIEQKYEILKVEIQEVSLRTKENVNSEISFKQREFERSKISLKQLSREEEDLKENLSDIKNDIGELESSLEKKKQQDEELSRKFEILILEKDELQSKIRKNEYDLSTKQHIISNIEGAINDLKIEKARFDAVIENYETEMLGFEGIEIIKASKEVLAQKLAKTEEILSKIGTVNLRSLEVYEAVKKEYDLIKEKVEIIEKEKNSVLKIIHEIDIKKKKTFIKTLDALDQIFSRNFNQLSTKGQVTLELENRKNPFDGGVNIIVKTGHGKYFDVKSLSGGEQTLVALSLIFGIQELKPYYFYILDEIDAALDKRNSSRLAHLLKKYMQKGQYIIITHNDEIISEATNLYGVSMHDGISKIISLKI